MLLNNYFKWRLGMEDYVAVVTEGSAARYENLGMKDTYGRLHNILVSSDNNSSTFSVGNKNRMFSEGVGVMLSTFDTEYTKDAYTLGDNLVSWITGLNVQYSDVVEDGKLTRIFTVSGQSITQNASVKAVGITKTLYGSDSYNYLMAIYEPKEPIQLTAGQGFSFSFKWTEE